MEQYITSYLSSKTNAWSPATLRSEKSRLTSVAPHLDGKPATLWKALAPLAPYSRVTSYTRATAFWAWLTAEGLQSGPNPYSQWRLANSKLFENAYISKPVLSSYEEVRAKLEDLTYTAEGKRALELLLSAQRWCESSQQGATVTGKGGKIRDNYRPEIEGPDYTRSYTTFRRWLKANTGLTPHALRKLALTHLANTGAQAADLCAVSGWSSITTAYRYLQPKRTEMLKEMLHGR